MKDLTAKVISLLESVKKVWEKPSWVKWADKWISGEDRTRESCDAIWEKIEKHSPRGDMTKAAWNAALHAIEAAIEISSPRDESENELTRYIIPNAEKLLAKVIEAKESYKEWEASKK